MTPNSFSPLSQPKCDTFMIAPDSHLLFFLVAWPNLERMAVLGGRAVVMEV